MTKILIIEDDLALLQTLTIYLKTEDFEVESAEDGGRGFEKALAGGFDLIVLDYGLPTMNGLEICRRLREKGISTPIIMLTGKKREEIDKIVGLEVGADDYLIKPLSPRELLARIRAVLRRTGPVYASSPAFSLSATKTFQTPQRPPTQGTILAGKYSIIEPIGQGGMGVVYRAEDTKLERFVAVKFLPAELTQDPEARERFVREAKAAAAFSDPHICTVYGIEEAGDQSFIVMEYIEGQSLKQKILNGPLDQAAAVDIAIQVAEGLAAAHKKRIIHRDIKPGNIMITPTGQAKVMDFGLAKVLGGSLITREARTMGTVAYMSPEQAQGESIDPRTDIWSLGVVLYEMLTGQLPFKGERDQSIIHSILNHEAEPVTKIRKDLPERLGRIVAKMLSKKPGDRYQDMAEFLKDLKAAADGLAPVKDQPAPAKGRTLGGIKKIYVWLGLACLIVLIVLALLFL